MKQHIESLQKVLNEGDLIKGDRSGVGTLSIFGHQEEYNLIEGRLPYPTTRKLSFSKTLNELIWFIKGNRDVSFLEEKKIPFWTKWTDDESNTIGPMYPYQWRNKQHVSRIDKDGNVIETKKIDQLAKIIQDLKEKPFTRRAIISNYDLGLHPDESVAPIENVRNGKMALDPCHVIFQASIRPMADEEKQEAKRYRVKQAGSFGIVDTRPLPEYKLASLLYMRSNDAPIGKPHNIAQYSMLNFIIAHVLNLHPGKHIHQVGDLHIYCSQVEAVKEQITRTPSPLPTFYIRPTLTVEDVLNGNLTEEDFKLVDYYPQPAISFPLEG